MNAKTSRAYTPLNFAARFDSVEVARLLISHEAKVDAQANDGWSPLHTAAYTNSLKVAQLLIDNGANKNLKTNSGKKPIETIEIAIENGITKEYDYSKMVALLQ